MEELEEDPPVQGPMPYEPDDAPWKKKDHDTTGVRKLYALNLFFNQIEDMSITNGICDCLFVVFFFRICICSFRKLFADQSKSSIQRSTLSTISKMALSASPNRSVTN